MDPSRQSPRSSPRTRRSWLGRSHRPLRIRFRLCCSWCRVRGAWLAIPARTIGGRRSTKHGEDE